MFLTIFTLTKGGGASDQVSDQVRQVLETLGQNIRFTTTKQAEEEGGEEEVIEMPEDKHPSDGLNHTSSRSRVSKRYSYHFISVTYC